MALLDLNVENSDRRARVELQGELDISSAGRVEEQIEALQSEGLDLLVLDLRGLSFMDSTGLRLVVRTDEAARAEGTSFVIVRGPEAVHRVFEIVGLADRLEFADEPPV